MTPIGHALSSDELRLIRHRAEEGTEVCAVRDRRALLAELDRLSGLTIPAGGDEKKMGRSPRESEDRDEDT